MKQVSVIAHVRKAGVSKLFPGVTEWLGARGIGVRLLPEEARALRVPELGVAEETVFTGSDLVLVIGGDGTLLRASRLMNGLPIPVLGINMGKIGFLMRVGHDRMFDALERVIDGDFEIEPRMMLRAEATLADGEQRSYLALNEVLVGSHTVSRMGRMDVFLNEDFFAHFAADGLIIATPTGATAYSLSAGGPLVSPTLDLILLTPICPHSLFDRSLVVGGDDVVTIRHPEKEASKMRFSYDGVAINDEVKEVKVVRAGERVNFVVIGGPGYYATLRSRLSTWDHVGR